MKRSETIAEFAKAMAKFQETVEQPKKDENNTFFGSKYVPFDNIVKTVNKTGPALGLSFTQWAVQNEKGQIGIATLVMHSSGEFMEFEPVFYNAEKNTVQGGGSVQSYLRRYALSAAYGLAGEEDDDGNAASQQNQGPTPAQKQYEQNKAAKNQQSGNQAPKNQNNGQQHGGYGSPDDKPKPNPEQAGPEEEKITEPQRKAIHAKLKTIGEAQNTEKDKVYPRIQEIYKTNTPLDQLSKKGASALLKILTEYEGGKALW